MKYRTIATEVDFTFTNVKSSNERIFLFQLKDEDIQKLNKFFIDNPFKDEFISKENKIINSLNTMSDIQKSEYLKLVLEYIDLLHDIDFNNAYFFHRKTIGYTLNTLHINKTIFDSTLTRIKENFWYYMFTSFSNDKENLYENSVAISNFFDFERDIIQSFYDENDTNVQLKGILNSLENLTEIDFIPTINSSAKKVDSDLDSIKQTIKILEKSSRSNSKKIESIVSNSNNLSKNISDNKSDVEMAIDEIFSINNDFRKTEATINDLVMNIRTINSIVVAIKNISEQTTLLAINASIEASRAEAEGKGFSVIAEEIRNLSEQTTSSVERITNIIQKFEENTYRLEKNTKDVIGRLNQKTKRTTSATSNLEIIFETTEDILKSIFTISKDFDNIEVASSELLGTVDSIKQDNRNINLTLNKLGGELFKVTEFLNESKEQIEENIKQIRFSEILSLFSIHVKQMYWELYNYRIGVARNAVSIKDYENYFTNYFIHLSKNKSLSEISFLDKLKQTHNNLIKSSEKTKFFIERGEYDESDKELKTLKALANEFIMTCEALSNVLPQ